MKVALMGTLGKFVCRAALVLPFGIAFASFVPGNAVAAERYWACPGSYVLQVKKNAVRCFLAAHYQYKALESCPRVGGVGYGLVQDYKGYEDYCVSQSPISPNIKLELKTTCRKYLTKQIRRKSRGKDRCRIHSPNKTTNPYKEVRR